MSEDNIYTLYNSVIQAIMKDEEKLPSLPSVTLKIRQAISNPHTEINELAQLIKLDPSLSALLLKYAASPLYRRPIPPKTIEAVLSMVGMPTLENLVLTHSIKSLFIMKDPKLKKLFHLCWERMIYKAAISLFLGKKLGLRPAEQAMTTSLLTEVGTLALLSAFSGDIDVPDENNFIELCKQYSKPLTGIILSKWGMDKNTIKISQYTGKWELKINKKLTMLDILNLAIYATVQHQSLENDLPAIETISAYNKLPQTINTLTPTKELQVIKDNIEELDNIINSLK